MALEFGTKGYMQKESSQISSEDFELFTPSKTITERKSIWGKETHYGDRIVKEQELRKHNKDCF